jgi:flagellar biosynthesis protein FliR
MNIFIVGFPLQIGVGLIVFGLMIPFMVKMFERLILGLNSQVSWLLKLM